MSCDALHRLQPIGSELPRMVASLIRQLAEACGEVSPLIRPHLRQELIQERWSLFPNRLVLPPGDVETAISGELPNRLFKMKPR
jgi:hypothetical protein